MTPLSDLRIGGRRFCYLKKDITLMLDLVTESAQHTDAGAPGGTPTGTTLPAVEAPKLTQEQFNAALAAEKRQWKQQQDTQVAEAKRKAAESEAAAKGEFEKLANERGARLAQIEAEHVTATERIAAYETEMERQIKDRLKALPDAIREMEPDGDMIARFAWLAKAEKLALTFAAPANPQRPPMVTPSGPRGSGQSTIVQAPDVMAQKRAQGGYDL